MRQRSGRIITKGPLQEKCQNITQDGQARSQIKSSKSQLRTQLSGSQARSLHSSRAMHQFQSESQNEHECCYQQEGSVKGKGGVKGLVKGDQGDLRGCQGGQLVELAVQDPASIVRKLSALNTIFREIKQLKQTELNLQQLKRMSSIEDRFISIEREILKTAHNP